jgi:hypothetical protein
MTVRHHGQWMRPIVIIHHHCRHGVVVGDAEVVAVLLLLWSV